MLPKLIRCRALFLVALLAAPAAASAECVTITLPEGERPRGPFAKPTLVFSGTVTTKLIVAGGIEGATVHSFKAGTAYLVSYFGDIHLFGVTDPYFPVGALGVAFGCGDGPIPLSKADAELQRLGRGRAPLP